MIMFQKPASQQSEAGTVVQQVPEHNSRYPRKGRSSEALKKVFGKVKKYQHHLEIGGNFLKAPVSCDRSIRYVLLAANQPKLQSDILGPQKNIYHL